MEQNPKGLAPLFGLLSVAPVSLTAWENYAMMLWLTSERSWGSEVHTTGLNQAISWCFVFNTLIGSGQKRYGPLKGTESLLYMCVGLQQPVSFSENERY